MEEGEIKVIDLFAGPGGLGEGFASYTSENGARPYDIILSIEKNKFAHNTLLLRNFTRQFASNIIPIEYYDILRGDLHIAILEDKFPSEWRRANEIAVRAELGNSEFRPLLRASFRRALRECRGKPVIIIGGPPCQAYSVVGRSRNRGNADYVMENDIRHILYKEYLKCITKVWPHMFIMENVKGLLSSKYRGEKMFQRIIDDLHNPGNAIHRNNIFNMDEFRYDIYPLVYDPETENHLGVSKRPASFIVRSEEHGIPQTRHRVFILGVRQDLKIEKRFHLRKSNKCITTGKVLSGLPRIRSGISRGRDSKSTWRTIIQNVTNSSWLNELSATGEYPELVAYIKDTISNIDVPMNNTGSNYIASTCRENNNPLKEWYFDNRLGGACNHIAKAHMPMDIHRYLFVSAYGRTYSSSPVLGDFPESLLPTHNNVKRAIRSRSLFSDRFRVQLEDKPASTITSHIAKDGHYYIHYDVTQCRSLTVREAARLQTFPDNYVFLGPRTAQYVQVGNAVPPLLAQSIAKVVHANYCGGQI